MIISRLIERHFLGRYEESGFIIQQKVKILVKVVLTLMTVLLFLFSYLPFFKFSTSELLIRLLAIVCCCCILILIKKGGFPIAGHLLLIIVLSGIWTVMFTSDSGLLMRADSVVLIVCTLTSGAIVLDVKKWMISIYLLANSIILFVFSLVLKETYGLNTLQSIDYFSDGFIALFFASFVSYHTITINRLALDKANLSLELAKDEASKNKRLTETLEEKVRTRTEKLSQNNEELQREIQEREQTEIKLMKAQKTLVKNAHKAGMAEIATDVLHNVGNILNSVKTSTYVIQTTITQSSIEGFSKACNLLRENKRDLKDYLFNDETGLKIIDYFLALDSDFQTIFKTIEDNASRLNIKIDTITDVIVAQQNYADSSLFMAESLDVVNVVKDALNVVSDMLGEKQIQLEQSYQPVPLVQAQKMKLLHTIINLVKNATHAMDRNTLNNRKLTISVFGDSHSVQMKFKDNGEGIEENNLNKIFNHGFTTRKDGYGFGLHSCANYLTEMGATIEARSDGHQMGATFTIFFPI